MSDPRNSSNNGSTVPNPGVIMNVKEANPKYLLSAERQIPKGYKQTEVGVIPEDWIASPITIATKEIFLGLTSKVDYVEINGVPLIRASDIATGQLNFENARTISVNQHKKLTQYRQARRGDVLVSKSGSLGVCAIVDTEREFSIYESIIVLQPCADLHSGYLLGLLRSEETQARMIGGKVGSTVSHLNLGMFRDLIIPVPPTKAEQEAIAEALSDADALIEALEQLVAKKRQLKQGAMQELLTGKRRLQGFSGEWEGTTLGNVGAFLKGSGVRKDEANNGSLPCIRYGEIYTHHNDYIKQFNSWISVEVAATATMLKQGDLLFAGSGETKAEIGKCVAFIDNCEAYAGGDIVIFRPFNANSTFMGYFCNTSPINAQKASKGQGDAVVHISAAAISDIAIKLPSLAEQTAIAQILTDMDTEITELETKLTKASAVKQGMMQQLLTGKIRLI